MSSTLSRVARLQLAVPGALLAVVLGGCQTPQVEPAGSQNVAPAAGSSAQTSGTSAADDGQITLSTPSMTGPLTANPHPMSLDAGDLGPIYVTGALSGLAMYQTNKTPGDHSSQADISNAQVFLQKPEGLFQFYAQAGAYSLPALGTAYVRSADAADAFYGTLPTAFVKVVPTGELSVTAGKLPTLFGAESTFTFQNMHVERGLLWNQENAINRGVQGNYAQGPIALSLSVNDGFYSNHYDWITGAATYTLSGGDSFYFYGGGNIHEESKSTLATPLAQNNSRIWGLVYNRTAGPWKLSPYVQYTQVPENGSIGINDNASTRGAAMLVTYTFGEHFSLAGRAEYIDATGKSAAPNLLYGPGSNAWSLTLTPTWQYGRFFVRPEVSYVRATDSTDGFAFGSNLSDDSQVRALVELGVLF